MQSIKKQQAEHLWESSKHGQNKKKKRERQKNRFWIVCELSKLLKMCRYGLKIKDINEKHCTVHWLINEKNWERARGMEAERREAVSLLCTFVLIEKCITVHNRHQIRVIDDDDLHSLHFVCASFFFYLRLPALYPSSTYKHIDKY